MNAKEIADWSEGIFGWIDGSEGGWRTYTYDERLHLAEAALDAVPEGGCLLEIGTYTGLSSSVLLQVARQKKARIGLVDMFMWSSGYKEGAQEVERYCRSVLCQFPDVWWRFYYTSSAQALEQATSQPVDGHITCPAFINHDIDFLHIDGNHLDVKNDCKLWFPHLKEHCTVAFHDANPNPAAEIGCMVVRDALLWTPDWEEVHWSKDNNCLMVRKR